MPIDGHSIHPAMIEAEDHSHVDVVESQMVYGIIGGTALLNGALAIQEQLKHTAARIGPNSHA